MPCPRISRPSSDLSPLSVPDLVMFNALMGIIIFTSAYLTPPARKLLMAAAALATVPVIIVYGFAQRWFVRGPTLSGFRGW